MFTFCSDSPISNYITLVGDEDYSSFTLEVLVERRELRLRVLEGLVVGHRVQHEVRVHIRHDGWSPGLYFRFTGLQSTSATD